MPSLKTLRHQEVLFTRLVEELTQLRIDEPDRALSSAQKRKRRSKLAPDGRLLLLAADHPARGIVEAGDQPLAMADRQDFLIRIVRVLSAGTVDGIISTMDVIEELLLLHDLMQARGLPQFLNEKLLIVSLNQSGLAGAGADMEDPLTGPTPQQCGAWRADGVKMQWRYADGDKGSLKTLRLCAKTISAANAAQLPFFLEPVVAGSEAGAPKGDRAVALAPLVGAATALGDSSRYLWLSLPYCADFAVVARCTTLPVLLRMAQDDANFVERVKEGLASAHNVRGIVTGRNVLYPVDQDPVEAARAIYELVHPRQSS